MPLLHRKETITRPRVYRGTYYYPTYDVATVVLLNLQADYPTARLVLYERGWAIQREKRGPYFGLKGWT